MSFEIPNKIIVGGNEIQVSIVPKIVNSEVLGQCCLASSLIEIAEIADGIKQSESSMEQTFFHELVHCILDTMGEHELSHNEKFVCTFSSLLNGAIKSIEQP